MKLHEISSGESRDTRTDTTQLTVAFPQFYERA